MSSPLVKVTTANNRIYYINKAHIISVRPKDSLNFATGAVIEVYTGEKPHSYSIAAGATTNALLDAFEIK